MRLLVTRPAEDAGPLARLLEERGHQVVLEPLLDIVPCKDAELNLNGVQAVLFTSANGVRAFAELSYRRSFPVFAVGDSTAHAAAIAGFSAVESAGGDVADLAALVARKCDPKNGALLHPAASQVAGDLKGLLEKQGFEVRRAVIYEAKPRHAFSSETVRLFQDALLDGVMFFSPRTAQSFARLAVQANIKERLGGVLAFALSKAVAAPIESLGFRSVRVASSPDQDALLARIDEEPMTSEQEQTDQPQSESLPPSGDVLPQPVRSAKRTLTAFLIGGVLGIGLVAGAGALLWPMLVDALKNEMSLAEDAAPQPAQQSEALSALAARYETLSRRLVDLEAKLSAPPKGASGVQGMTPDELERLNARFLKIEQELQALSTKRDTGSSLLVAALLLREAHVNGRAFEKEIETLSQLAASDPEIVPHLTALKPLAEKGVASQESLSTRFAELKPLLLRSTMDANEDLWTGVKRRLSALITIRRIDAQAEDMPSLEGYVGRAELALSHHDLALAVAELSNLVGPAGELAKPWQADAIVHVEAEKHAEAILDLALLRSVKP